MIKRAKFLNLFLAVTIALVSVIGASLSQASPPTATYAQGETEISSWGPPTWTVGDNWTFDAKYYMSPPTLEEDDTEVITVVSLDPGGSVVGDASYTLPEDCYGVTAEFTEDPGSPPSQNPGLVDRHSVIGWVVLNPLTPPLTWNSQQTLDEVYREAWVGALFIPFEWEYLEEAVYGYVPTADHGWPYDLGKEYAMHVFAEVLIGGPGGPILTTVNTYVIVEVVGEVVITVPAGTFTCKHVVQWEVLVTVTGDPIPDANGHWQKTGAVGSETWFTDDCKFRAKYIDRGTYTGEQVDELESYTVVSEPPAVTTNSASDVTTDSATLNGTLDDLGTALSVDVSFEWGLDTGYGNETTAETMATTGSFNADLSALDPGTTYHFRAKAVGDGTGYGDDMTLTTVLPGDANMDGVVDVFDLVKVKRIILGLDPPTPGADANQDGEVDVFDLVKIKRIILGIDT